MYICNIKKALSPYRLVTEPLFFYLFNSYESPYKSSACFLFFDSQGSSAIYYSDFVVIPMYPILNRSHGLFHEICMTPYRSQHGKYMGILSRK